MTGGIGRIIAGIGDTEEADKAIRWAAQHAVLTGRPLHLVHAFVWPLMGVDVDPVPGVSGSGLKASADRLVEEAIAVARDEAPDAMVTGEVVDGRALDVLLSVQRPNDTIVVGSRGLGRFLALIVGSTSLALIARASANVVVVRGSIDDGPIAAFYDGQESFEQIVTRAARLAELHRTSLRVYPSIAIPHAEWPRVLEEAKRIVARHHEDVEVDMTPYTEDHSAKALIQRAEGTRMIVAAARTQGEERRSAAPTTVSLLQYAHTPVWLERV
ncbi:universal stress protein [Helcobacillus sp. ACRRO]|uniref:universal stress protein n=1 Tax=Helcobacillus sp. ACRRO TaxID=2918202 RepID=UPI001EF4B00B|nr:universal stress protein [Helcobacillus sp. ACRRO]MCG7426771.1 universal stress protein [Helcobacillus sp. ACRRO]